MSPAPETVADRSFGAAKWVAVSTIGNVLFSFVVFLILARLLQPAEFGLVAVAVVFIDILLIVTRGGLPDYVVQRHDISKSLLDTAFLVSLATSLFYCLVLLAAAGPVAALLRLPELKPILQFLSVTFVIAGLGAIHEGRLQREFGFRSLAIRALASNLVGGSVAIALALDGYGAWSLVVQRLAAVTMTTVLTWMAFPWLPGLSIRPHYAREQLAFGARVFSTQLLLTTSIRVQEVIAAYFLSTSDVGMLRLAWRCIDLVSQVAVIPLTAVALPAYARVQSDRPELARTFYRFVAASATIALPCFLGMAAVAPVMIPFLFGGQWAGAAPVLQILCLLAPEFVATSFIWMTLTAANRTGLALWLAALQFAVTLAAALVAAPFGLSALVIGHVLRAYIVSPVIFDRIGRVSGIALTRTLREMAPILACSAVMAGLVFLLRRPVYGAIGEHAGLFVEVGIGALVYGGLMALVAPDMMRAALRSLRPRR